MYATASTLEHQDENLSDLSSCDISGPKGLPLERRPNDEGGENANVLPVRVKLLSNLHYDMPAAGILQTYPA